MCSSVTVLIKSYAPVI